MKLRTSLLALSVAVVTTSCGNSTPRTLQSIIATPASADAQNLPTGQVQFTPTEIFNKVPTHVMPLPACSATLAAGCSDENGLLTVFRAEDPTPAQPPVVVFSNFGKKNHLYEDTVAWDVAGPDSGVQQQWVAMPFTPSFDAQVTQISVAVEHNEGSPNSFVLSLTADNGGRVPGKVIRSWIVSHAPKFRTCCTLDTVSDIKPPIVNKGTQYWLVAETDGNEEGTRMEWDLSPQAIEGNFALNNGKGWYGYTAFTSAFAIHGRSVH